MVSIIDLKSIMDHPYLPVHIHDVPLRGPVRGIAVNPTNNMTYVATDLSMDSNGKEIGEVVVINGSTNDATHHIPLKVNHSLLSIYGEGFNGPEDITVVQNTNKIYVPIGWSNAIAVIDGNTNREISPIIVSKSLFFDIEVNNIDNSIYLVNDDANRVYVIDSNTDKIIKTIMGNISGEVVDPVSFDTGFAFSDVSHSSIAVNPYTKTIYIGRYVITSDDPSKIYVIDGNTDRMIKSFDVSIKPSEMTFNPLTNMTYIVDYEGNKISVIDGNTNEILLGKDVIFEQNEITPISTGLEIGFDPFKVMSNPDTNRNYILYNRSKEISIINGNNDTIVNTVFYDGYPTDIALNSQRNLIYVTYPSLNLTAVIDGRTNKVVGNITDIDNPLYLTTSPYYNEIYITNNSRSVFIIDGYTNRLHSIVPVGVIPREIEIDENLEKIFVTYFAEDAIQSILYIDKADVLLGEYDNSTISRLLVGKSAHPPVIVSNPNRGVIYAGYADWECCNVTIEVIDAYANRIATNITIYNPLGLLDPTDIAINAEENLIYLTTIFRPQKASGVIYTIDIKNDNKIISNETLGLYTTDVDLNPATDLVYATNKDSDTLSIINAKDHKPTVGVNFKVSPPDAGEIICGGSDSGENEHKQVSQTYVRFPIGARIECDAKASSGYQFSSWAGDYGASSSHIESLDTTGYGELEAKFVIPFQVNIPSEFWAPLYALIPGFFIPSIIKYLNDRRQRRYLRQYRQMIENTYKKLHEKRHDCIRALDDIQLNVRRIYEQGKINEAHQEILSKTISRVQRKNELVFI